MKLTKKQILFLEAFEKHATNISRACKVVNIDRGTHYNWFSTNSTYKEKIEAIQESMIDFAESMLYKNMKSGKESSILFFLKTRGRDRGYIEKQDINMRTNVSFENETLREIQEQLKNGK